MTTTRTGTPKRPLWCGRCHKIIFNQWEVSWFTDEEICVECAGKEVDIKAGLVKAGKNPGDYEGCGYLPEI